MRPLLLVLLFAASTMICGCKVIKVDQNYDLENGIYKKISGSRIRTYVKSEDSLIRLFPLEVGSANANRQNEILFLFPQTRSFFNEPSLRLLRTSFDLDVITIPFKYRFATNGFPNQFNANFSGAFYCGLRNDVYSLDYKKDALGEYHRAVSRHGYGIGLFAGIGSTAMNPWVTSNQINIEYDGFLLIGGLQTLFAFNKINFGLGLGTDHLMDKNRRFWIYRRKPWLGLTVGLNLN